MRLKLLRRTAFFSLLLPFVYFGTASATFLYRIHAENSARGLHLPTQSAPTSNQRILIFAPHPDDETLGCAGLIQQAKQKGASVQVVLLTNGDGFRVAVERQFRQLRVEPKDYVRFAAIRQQETYRALANLGLAKAQVTFLGYPDRGLLALWNDHWNADRPYVSPYTRCDRSPYEIAYRPGANYCGQSLLDTLKTVLRDTKPTDVYITHPSDDHPDHTAASSFVTLAMEEVKREDTDWTRKCNLHYYIVHRGDWPAPQGLNKTDALVPPNDMAALDTHWSSRPLSEEQISRKEKSILTYSSQTSVMKKFLLSFARRNELFGSLDPATVPRVEEGHIQPDGVPAEWQGLMPVVLDPVNDNLLRDFQGGGDIRALYACHDATRLYLRIDTYQPISNRVEFRLSLRYFGDERRKEAGGLYSVVVRPSGTVVPSSLQAERQENRLEIAIPLRNIGYSKHLALDINSFFAGIQVDHTGFRFLEL